jgi:hypothetical protein
MIAGDYGEVEDDEAGLPTVEEEVLQIHGHGAVGKESQNDRDQDIGEYQPCCDDPTLHASDPLPESPEENSDQTEVDAPEVDVEGGEAKDRHSSN